MHFLKILHNRYTILTTHKIKLKQIQSFSNTNLWDFFNCQKKKKKTNLESSGCMGDFYSMKVEDLYFMSLPAQMVISASPNFSEPVEIQAVCQRAKRTNRGIAELLGDTYMWPCPRSVFLQLCKF